MRVVARKERPHPSAQLRITDVDGHRVTAFATNTRAGGRSGGRSTQLPPWSCGTAAGPRCEDRIRVARDTGLTNLPRHGFDQKLHLVTLATEVTAWMQLLALAGHDARRWEPKGLRHRLFTIPLPLPARAVGSG